VTVAVGEMSRPRVGRPRQAPFKDPHSSCPAKRLKELALAWLALKELVCQTRQKELPSPMRMVTKTLHRHVLQESCQGAWARPCEGGDGVPAAAAGDQRGAAAGTGR